MRAVGLITEYNPFHNGHLHHLQESLRLSGADIAVAVMSGHFSLPLVANVSRFRAVLKKHYGGDSPAARLAFRMFQSDLRGTRLHAVLMRRWEGDRNRDFYEEVRGLGGC